MSFVNKIKFILYIDNFVSKHREEEEHYNQEGIGLIAALAFFVMSLLNIKQRSFMMLITTGMSALFLLIGYVISRYKHNTVFLKGVFYSIFVAVFTFYTIEGGNEGFAALWLITATYAVMLAIDFKAGFVISTYYFIMLILVFIGPLSGILRYDYNETFLLRFPFLYAINFAFATYIVIRIRKYQYELLINQQNLEHMSLFDLSTGLRNRNYFIQYEQSFSDDNLKTLSAVFIDVNGLHELNNREGHAAGDRMLCYIADLCKKYFAENCVYRMGGDEFLILCENIDENRVQSSAKELFAAVEQAGYSISYGLEIQKSEFDLNELVKAADEKMIKFKKDFYQVTSQRKR